MSTRRAALLLAAGRAAIGAAVLAAPDASEGGKAQQSKEKAADGS